MYFDGNSQKTNQNIGGFVQISFVDKEQEEDDASLMYPKKVLDIIQNLDTSFEKNDVCVLVRTRKQGVQVANFLSENK